MKSATSTGANVEEAQSAESKADFIHKYSIAQKEVHECIYWLRLLEKSKIISSSKLTSLINETKEIAAVITKIIINAKKNK